ncbi:MAG: metal-dependent hydrolase [Desulfobacterales bacterium]|nr:metal-dependent hydrolase [Desulfobacterales bacterium]
MDPVTQGLTGIIAAQSVSDNRTIRYAAVAGLIGGVLPDVDVFIHSFDDPLFNLLIHRHFTHALIFIPAGGLIAAGIAWLLLKRRPGFKKTWFFATLGYATGGLLDACTSYGTYLYWPFSDHRVAWDNIAIIDPAYTLVLFVFIVLAYRKKARRLAAIGLVLGLCYLAAGFAAKNTATRILTDTAKRRGHEVERMRVMPTIGNLILWRGIYETNGGFHVDAVRLGLFSAHHVYSGPAVQKFRAAECAKSPKKRLYCRNIELFSHFADGYIFEYAQDPLIIGDLRYAMLPHQVKPLWGLVATPQKPGMRSELRYFTRVRPATLKDFWKMLAGQYPG